MSSITYFDELSVARRCGHEVSASSDFDLWSDLPPKYACSCEDVYTTLVSGSEPIMRTIDRVDHML